LPDSHHGRYGGCGGGVTKFRGPRLLPRPSFAWRTPASAADMWMLSPIPHEPLLKAGPPSLKLRDTETYSQKPAYGEARPAGGYRTGRADPNACGIKLRT